MAKISVTVTVTVTVTVNGIAYEGLAQDIMSVPHRRALELAGRGVPMTTAEIADLRDLVREMP